MLIAAPICTDFADLLARAGLYAPVQPVQSSGATCGTYFWPRISRDFTSSECRHSWRVFHRLRETTFAQSPVRAGGDAVITLCTQLLFPDGKISSAILPFPSGWCPWPCSVRRQRGNRQCVGARHGGGNSFHEIPARRRETTGGRCALCGLTAAALPPACLRQGQCLPVTLSQITVALLLPAFWQSRPAAQRGRYRPEKEDMRQVEESHLHDGEVQYIDAGASHSRAIFAALTT